MSNSEENHTALTAEIVSAYVANNSVQAGNLPALIASIHTAVSGLGVVPAPEAPIPAVNPKRSIFPDYIISLEDGRKFKSMKRHLWLLGMTPDQYRVKWALPRDYPMVAPNYAAARSALAKKSGLGRKAEPVKATASVKKKAPSTPPAKARRGRKTV
jgi:predicted transcriptional regulator